MANPQLILNLIKLRLRGRQSLGIDLYQEQTLLLTKRAR